jgi:hypothetical protein
VEESANKKCEGSSCCVRHYQPVLCCVVVAEVALLETADNELKQDNAPGQDAAVSAASRPASEKLEREIVSLEAAAIKVEQEIASLKATVTVSDTKVVGYEQEIVSLKAAASKVASYAALLAYIRKAAVQLEEENTSLKAAATKRSPPEAGENGSQPLKTRRLL